MVPQPPFSRWAAMSFLWGGGGTLKSSVKTSSVLIVLIVFVSPLLVGESNYDTHHWWELQRFLQLQVGGVFLTGHLCVLIKSILKKNNWFHCGFKNFANFCLRQWLPPITNSEFHIEKCKVIIDCVIRNLCHCNYVFFTKPIFPYMTIYFHYAGMLHDLNVLQQHNQRLEMY